MNYVIIGTSRQMKSRTKKMIDNIFINPMDNIWFILPHTFLCKLSKSDMQCLKFIRVVLPLKVLLLPILLIHLMQVLILPIPTFIMAQLWKQTQFDINVHQGYGISTMPLLSLSLKYFRPFRFRHMTNRLPLHWDYQFTGVNQLDVQNFLHW